LLRLPREESRRRTEALLERVGLGRAGDLGVRRYSKGMTQRLGIAQALLGDPDVVILDEPVSGLDPVGRREMRDLMLELKEQGKTVFFSTHIIPDVELVCDRVGMIIAGKLVREGSVDALLSAGTQSVEVVLGSLDPAKAAQIFPDLEARPVSGAVALLVPEGAVDSVLSRALAEGATVRSVQPRRRALEDLFLEEAAAGHGDDVEPRARFGAEASHATKEGTGDGGGTA
ncbi:MAG: ABC transporter ATP-binding protein, partial [Deltaproteobacteria bacterium]